jgi:hypothetical protein
MPARDDVAARARQVLDRNRRGGWTCPADGHYPHQWLWDSCFVAMGMARDDPARAAGELRALFRGQWSNGMMPHMIFAPGSRDVGSRRIWQSHRFAEAPADLETSCITQPPLPSVAVWHVAQELDRDERVAFLRECFPRLVEYHRWLYRERDPDRRGLVTLIHPWECGLDTTPPWMREMRRVLAPWWLRLVFWLRLDDLLRMFRRDTKLAPHSERSSSEDGLRMLVLVRRAKRHRFQLSRMPRRRTVLIEDLAFNSLLAVSNRALQLMAGELASPIDPELTTAIQRTEVVLEELWDDEAGQYRSRNAVTDDLIELPTVATFLPLWAGTAAPNRAERLLGLLEEGSGFWPRFPVPSVPTDARQYDEDRYWKGPTWINLNWCIIQGLRVYGDSKLAEELQRRTVELVAQSGFAEYFSAQSGAPYGAADFSWTAALALDLAT